MENGASCLTLRPCGAPGGRGEAEERPTNANLGSAQLQPRTCAAQTCAPGVCSDQGGVRAYRGDSAWARNAAGCSLLSASGCTGDVTERLLARLRWGSAPPWPETLRLRVARRQAAFCAVHGAAGWAREATAPPRARRLPEGKLGSSGEVHGATFLLHGPSFPCSGAIPCNSCTPWLALAEAPCKRCPCFGMLCGASSRRKSSRDQAHTHFLHI